MCSPPRDSLDSESQSLELGVGVGLGLEVGFGVAVDVDGEVAGVETDATEVEAGTAKEGEEDVNW